MHWDTYQSMSCKISSYLPFHFFIFVVRLFRLNTKNIWTCGEGGTETLLYLWRYSLSIFCGLTKNYTGCFFYGKKNYCSTEIKQISNIINVMYLPFYFLRWTNVYFSHSCKFLLLFLRKLETSSYYTSLSRINK